MPAKVTASEHSAQKVPEDLTLGLYLRNERERRALSIEEMHQKTGIQLSTLKALENDQRHELPADVFVQGFIKLYTKALDLDPQYALALHVKIHDLNQKKPEALTQSDLLGSETLAESPLLFTRNKLLFILLCFLLLVLAYVLFINQPFSGVPWRNYFPLQTSRPTAVDPVEQTAQKIASPVQDRQVKANSVKESPPVTEEPKDPMKQSAEEQKQEEDSEQAAMEPETPLKPSAEDQPKASGEEGEAQPENEPPATELADGIPTQYNHTLSASFTEITWVRVEIDDNESKEALFRPGDSITWKAEKKIELLLGNSGGATLLFDGNPVKLKSQSGKVLRLTLP